MTPARGILLKAKRRVAAFAGLTLLLLAAGLTAFATSHQQGDAPATTASHAPFRAPDRADVVPALLAAPPPAVAPAAGQAATAVVAHNDGPVAWISVPA